MSLPYVLCPKCNQRSESKDYWTCPACSYSETREWVLQEDNKDYEEEREKLIEVREEEERKWLEEQEELANDIVEHLLPKSKYNWTLNCSQDLGNPWGRTFYHENDPQEVRKFKQRHLLDLVKNGYAEIKILPNGQQVIIPLYPYYADASPTEIYIAQKTLTTEGNYKFNDGGFLTTIPHECGHASPEVKRHPKFQPFSQAHGNGWGHDDIWRNKAQSFHDKAISKYQEKVKQRFKILKKIKKNG